MQVDFLAHLGIDLLGAALVDAERPFALLKREGQFLVLAGGRGRLEIVDCGDARGLEWGRRRQPVFERRQSDGRRPVRFGQLALDFKLLGGN